MIIENVPPVVANPNSPQNQVASSPSFARMFLSPEEPLFNEGHQDNEPQAQTEKLRKRTKLRLDSRIELTAEELKVRRDHPQVL